MAAHTVLGLGVADAIATAVAAVLGTGRATLFGMAVPVATDRVETNQIARRTGQQDAAIAPGGRTAIRVDVADTHHHVHVFATGPVLDIAAVTGALATIHRAVHAGLRRRASPIAQTVVNANPLSGLANPKLALVSLGAGIPIVTGYAALQDVIAALFRSAAILGTGIAVVTVQIHSDTHPSRTTIVSGTEILVVAGYALRSRLGLALSGQRLTDGDLADRKTLLRADHDRARFHHAQVSRTVQGAVAQVSIVELFAVSLVQALTLVLAGLADSV